jgi:hypothetical protein
MGKFSSRQRRQARREAAKARQEAYDALTDEEKLQKLLRGGYGECKQAKQLQQKVSSNG